MFRPSLDGKFAMQTASDRSIRSVLKCRFVLSVLNRSIPDEQLDKINAELESDIMIRAIHDVKGIDMGNSLVRYKAELDFDGRELSRFYLDKQDLGQLLEVRVATLRRCF